MYCMSIYVIVCIHVCVHGYMYICQEAERMNQRRRGAIASIELGQPFLASICINCRSVAREDRDTKTPRLRTTTRPQGLIPIVPRFVPCGRDSHRALLHHARFLFTPLSTHWRRSPGFGQIHDIQASKRMPRERADDGGPSGQRRKKARAADPSTSNTSGKVSAEMLDHSAPKKRRTAEKLCEHQID